jgi:Homeodomain-like domain
MGFQDAACIAFRLSQAVYRPLFEQVWGDSLDIHWPPDTEKICDTPGGAAVLIVTLPPPVMRLPTRACGIARAIAWPGKPTQSVNKWAAELQAKGRAGLKKAGRAGRKPRLSAEQIKQIERGLKRGPQALGYATSLWTANRVVHLIEQECGVS